MFVEHVTPTEYSVLRVAINSHRYSGSSIIHIKELESMNVGCVTMTWHWYKISIDLVNLSKSHPMILYSFI